MLLSVPARGTSSGAQIARLAGRKVAKVVGVLRRAAADVEGEFGMLAKAKALPAGTAFRMR